MSRTKDLKTNPEFNINLFELFSLFSPGKKTKYTETLLRVMKKTPNLDEHCNEIRLYLSDKFGFDMDELNNIPTLHLMFFYRLIDNMFNESDLITFQKFCEFNERGLIKQNDLSRYHFFDDINNAVSMAEIISDSKELEKQIKVVYEDEEWLFIRPLTFNASKKYGSNTKWCTTTESNPEYFVKYSSRGVLIYCLNKKTGYKVASFHSLDKNEPEFSWWNQKDNRIDSLQSELPDELLKVIRVESMENKPKTNRFLLGDNERIKEEKFLSKYGSYKYMYQEEVPQPIANERIGRVRRRLELMEEDVNEQELQLINGEESMEVRQLVDAYPTSTEELPELGWESEEPMTENVPVMSEPMVNRGFDFRGDR